MARRKTIVEATEQESRSKEKLAKHIGSLRLAVDGVETHLGDLQADADSREVNADTIAEAKEIVAGLVNRLNDAIGADEEAE